MDETSQKWILDGDSKPGNKHLSHQRAIVIWNGDNESQTTWHPSASTSDTNIARNNNKLTLSIARKQLEMTNYNKN